ncbi:MAG: LLM class F420-dependent oxidoreductase [Thermodesulfobacteriota bacterium]|nr:MAG: LLM class F420-dependent oxidoreductase [Thermodesulfobacteriota bacterium]
MSRIATISPVWGCSVDDLRALARLAEGAGFEAILSPEVPPFSALTNAQVFAEATSNIKVGTWITNIYMRQAVMAAAEALTIQEITGGKMMLGLGVSHKPVNARYEIEMGDPVDTMRDYVGQVKAFMDGTAPQLTLKRDLPKVPVYIAGLTKGAANLAGEVADGLMPYMATVEYVTELRGYVEEGAKAAGRDPSEVDITLGIPSIVSDDLELAQKAGIRGFSPYLNFPFYQRLMINNGYEEAIDKVRAGEKPADVFTPEMLDAVALVGPADRCRAKLDEFRDAGVDLPIIVPGAAGKQSNVEVMEHTVAAYSG